MCGVFIPLKNRQCNLSYFSTTSIHFILSLSSPWLCPKHRTVLMIPVTCSRYYGAMESL